MGTLAQKELQEYADTIKGVRTFPPSTFFERLYFTSFRGKVYVKGRPRFSKAGFVHTPINTRKFEKLLSQQYTTPDSSLPIFCPIYVKIKIYDKMPKAFNKLERRLAEHGYIFSTVGDLADNKVKSIIDAGNGVLYADDSQIRKVSYDRVYTDFEGFDLEVCRAGLSPAEAHNLGNLLK